MEADAPKKGVIVKAKLRGLFVVRVNEPEECQFTLNVVDGLVIVGHQAATTTTEKVKVEQRGCPSQAFASIDWVPI